MTRSASERMASVTSFFEGVETLPDLFSRRAELTPSGHAFLTQRDRGDWEAVRWVELERETVSMSMQFAALGIGSGQRVGIIAATSVEWEIAQRALLRVGAIVVGIDPYYPDAVLNALLAELDLRGLIVEDEATLRRITPRALQRLSLLARVTGAEDSEPAFPSLRRLRARPPASSPMIAAPDASSPALVAFSSGSTGRPQALLYTHAQVVHACKCILGLYPELSDEARLVCWLPIANLFQRMINFCATAKGAASYVVADPRRVVDVLPIARPEVFVAVPRFLEKVNQGMSGRLEHRRAARRLVESTIALATKLRHAERNGHRIGPLARALHTLADRIVLSRLRAVFGGNLRYIVSGSAPMPRWLIERFEAIGIPVLEAYGVSGNLVPICAQRLSDRKPG